MPKPQRLLSRGVHQSPRDVQDSFETNRLAAIRIRSQSLTMTLSPVYPVCLCVWLATGAIECLPPSVELLVCLIDAPTADGEPPAMSAFAGMREGINW